jgi:hypothetical protein
VIPKPGQAPPRSGTSGLSRSDPKEALVSSQRPGSFVQSQVRGELHRIKEWVVSRAIAWVRMSLNMNGGLLYLAKPMVYDKTIRVKSGSAAARLITGDGDCRSPRARSGTAKSTMTEWTEIQDRKSQLTYNACVVRTAFHHRHKGMQPA